MLVQSDILPATVAPVSLRAASRPMAAPMPTITIEMMDFAIVGPASKRPLFMPDGSGHFRPRPTRHSPQDIEG